MSERQKPTTSGGAPVGDNRNRLSAGPHDLVWMQNWRPIEMLAHHRAPSAGTKSFICTRTPNRTGSFSANNQR